MSVAPLSRQVPVTFCLTLFLAFLACGPGEGQAGRRAAARSDAWTVTSCEGSAQASPARLAGSAAPREARVYLDGSASMKGFAGEGGRFSAVLSGLRGVLLNIGVVRNQMVRVGEKLENLQRTGGFEQFDEKSFYSRSETNLGAVLDRELNSTGGPSLALLVTDGVISLRADQGGVGALAECERGSDVECLSVKVGRLIQAGRGVWILGFRSVFHGTLYSERLRVGGGRLGEAKLADRPFYIWIITDHPASGRQLVERLFARLSERPDGGSAFALELAPGDIRWWLPIPDQTPASDSKLFPDGAANGAVRGKFSSAGAGRPPSQEAVSQDLDGTAFGLKIPLQATTLMQIPKEITPLWTYRSSYCLRWDGKAPTSALRVQAKEDGAALRFAMLSRSFASLAKQRVTIVQRLVRTGGEHDLLRRFERWSTDDDRSLAAGSRTFNFLRFLESLLARLDPPATYEQPILQIEFK